MPWCHDDKKPGVIINMLKVARLNLTVGLLKPVRSNTELSIINMLKAARLNLTVGLLKPVRSNTELSIINMLKVARLNLTVGVIKPARSNAVLSSVHSRTARGPGDSGLKCVPKPVVDDTARCGFQ